MKKTVFTLMIIFMCVISVFSHAMERTEKYLDLKNLIFLSKRTTKPCFKAGKNLKHGDLLSFSNIKELANKAIFTQCLKTKGL